MVGATHSAAVQDEKGTHYVGVATGLVLTIEDGPVLYHAGDTNVFGDMKRIAQAGPSPNLRQSRGANMKMPASMPAFSCAS